MDYPLVRAHIDLNAIQANLRTLDRLTPETCRVMAVVKADGYGHGSIAVARAALTAGADWLGVARFHEAEQLRQAGIDAPILIFGYTYPEQAAKVAGLDLETTVYGLEMAHHLSEAAVRAGVRLRVHLKVDTGMGRVGILPDSLRVAAPDGTETGTGALDEVAAMMRLPNLEVRGVYTHFAASDSLDLGYARRQVALFDEFLEGLRRHGIDVEIRHAANSGAVIQLPEAHYDMVRPGISLYGLYPSLEMKTGKTVLQPAMELHSVVTSVKRVPKGFPVSYGMTWRASRPTVIASVPVGYADGYSRLLSNCGAMLVRGRKAPIAGRVCMDQTLIDVGEIPGVKAGDPVVVMGRQEESLIDADEIAGLVNTINYEVVASLTARVHRQYRS